MPSEQTIQRKIIKYLEARDCYIVKVINATKAGVPDIVGCYEGRFFAIEVKTYATRHNTSKLQEYNLEKIRECGGHSIVAWDTEDLDVFLTELLL